MAAVQYVYAQLPWIAAYVHALWKISTLHSAFDVLAGSKHSQAINMCALLLLNNAHILMA